MKHQDILAQRNHAIARLVGNNGRAERELNHLRQFFKSWCEFHAECANPEATTEDKQNAAQAMTLAAENVRDLYGEH